MPVFLILFIIIPLAEVYAFINVGQEIGVFKTLILCVLTAIIGGALVKIQGLETLMKARENFVAGTIPINEIFDGICLVIAGALLLTPGFVTDAIGFALLVPWLRKILRATLQKYGKFNVGMTNMGQKQKNPYEDDVIEGDYEPVEPKKEKLDKPDKSL